MSKPPTRRAVHSNRNNSMDSQNTFRLYTGFGILLAAVSSFGATAPANTPKPRPNVILITIDTVRADHVGCYGAKNVQTPTLDSLAHDGIVFERAISQVPLTWPSHTVILTGTYPFQNGVQDFTGQPLAPQFRSVAQAFKDHGYRTGAVVSAFVLDRSWGLARGFDFYDDAFAPEQFKNRDLGLVERRAGESVTRALKWLQQNPHRPFSFGCIYTIRIVHTIRRNRFAHNFRTACTTERSPTPITNWGD